MQKILSEEQVSAFHHDAFVSDQVAHFVKLISPALLADGVVVDIGGGCGNFCRAIQNGLQVRARVIDMDPASVALAIDSGVDAVVGDALKPIKMVTRKLSALI